MHRYLLYLDSIIVEITLSINQYCEILRENIVYRQKIDLYSLIITRIVTVDGPPTTKTSKYRYFKEKK